MSSSRYLARNGSPFPSFNSKTLKKMAVYFESPRSATFHLYQAVSAGVEKHSSKVRLHTILANFLVA